MNVSEFIANFLIKNKVKHVFGFQGGAILKLVDTMAFSGKIEYIQNYHEQASAFCADAYARVTGNLGVAIATSGPGATNLITGIANAHFDSIPTLFITGQDYTYNIKKPGNARQDGFQEVDIVNMVKPITKYAVTIMHPEDVRYEFEKALYFAKSGRPGAVLIDIPIDIQFKEIDENKLKSFKPPKNDYNSSRIKDVIELLKKAKRPVVLAGGGIRLADALYDFENFINKTKIPVVTTLNALDCLENAYSFSGLYGNTHSNVIINNADVLLVLGSRLGLRQVGKFKENYTSAKIIQVDIDINEKNRSLKTDLFINDNLKHFLGELNYKITKETFPNYSDWIEQVESWAQKYSKNTYVNDEGIDPVEFISEVSKFFSDNAIITSDVGQNQMWVAQGFCLKKNQRLLNSSGHGAMGFSLPAAIGAKIANPNSQVIAFMGDGGLQMNLQELLTISHRNLNIKCIILNNNTLGMMREVQSRYFDSRFYGAEEKDFVCADLESLARCFNLNYLKISKTSNAADIANILADNKPALIDLRINSNSKLLNRYDESEIFEKEKLSLEKEKIYG